MDTNQIIQKVINGKTYFYDRKNDTIKIDKNHLYRGKANDAEIQICYEVTVTCNHYCENCFSNSGGKNNHFKYLDFSKINNNIVQHQSKIIRSCISGGEPFMHPHIEKILDLPNLFQDCGFAIVTNGTLKKHLDFKLIENKWGILISLHGREKAHNAYTNSSSFKTVVNRITKLASKGYVNIYTVLNNYLRVDDVKWLLKFRDDTGVNNISFLKPRPFGRHVIFKNETISDFIDEINDNRVRKMSKASNIPFIDVNGKLRSSN